MRNWKQIATLGLILAGLGGIATWDEWKSKQEEKEKETKGLALTLKPDSVTGIVLRTREDSDSGDKAPQDNTSKAFEMTLKLDNGRWEILSPVKAIADQQAVTDLLKNVTEYKTESEVADGKDKWGSFGLTNPRRSIELETNDGKKTSFFVGINTPVGFSVYIATSDNDKVFAGSQYIATSTAKTLFDLRDKKILPSSPASGITGIKLVQPSGSILVTRADGKWTIQSPTVMAADTASMNNLLDDIVGLKAAEFIDSPEKDMTTALGDSKTQIKIELTEDKGSNTLIVGDFKGATYAQVQGHPTIYKLHDDAKPKISKTLKELRDKKIFAFQSADVTKVTIDGKAFSKVENDWYLAADAAKFGADGKFSGKPEEKPKNAAHIRGLVVDLEYAKAEDVYDASSDLARKLPKAPKHHVSLGFKEKESEIMIDIWLAQDNPEMIYIKHSGSTQVFKSKRMTIASLTPAVSAPVGNEASDTALPAAATPALSN